jgi:hypothetical protein
MRLTPEALVSVIRRIDAAGHGNKRKTVELLAAEYGVSTATLYRAIEPALKTKKIDRGNTIPQEWINLVAAEKARSYTAGVTGRMLPTADCIEILERTGAIPKGVLTVPTVDRRLRDMGFHKQRTYQRHEDPYVNYKWQLDWSRSEYFDLYKQEKGVWLVRVDGRRDKITNKNKPSDGLWRLWVSSALETYSRAQILRYHAVTGENMDMFREQLQFAWQREDQRHPMRHLPEVFSMDQGAIGKNAMVMQRLQDDLSIRVILTRPKANRIANEQGHGKVERAFSVLWNWELKIMTILQRQGREVITLNELNDMVYEYCLERLQDKHPVLDMNRAQVYELGIRQRPQRHCATDISLLFYRTETRNADATGIISVYGSQYVVPEAYAGSTIRVFINPNGALVGQSLDGRDTFDLHSRTMSPGKRNHTQSVREVMASQPVPQATESFKKEPAQPRIEPVSPKNVVRFTPKGEQLSPESPFRSVNIEQPLANLNEFKLHICKRFNMSWQDFCDDEVFADWVPVLLTMFETGKLTKNELNRILDKVAV